MTVNDCKTLEKRCMDKFMSKADYFKDKFTMLGTVIGSSLIVIIVLIGFHIKQTSDIAVLKTQMKEIKKVIDPDKMSYSELKYLLQKDGSK
jgi:hypothetical protein